MFGFIKKVFVVAMTFFSFNVFSINCLECLSMKKQECKVREVIINNDYMLYPFSIKENKCNGNCNNVSNPYSRVCIPNVVKNITAKKCWIYCHGKIKQNKSNGMTAVSVCVYRLDPVICNNKQKWNKDKCRFECLVDKKCDNKFVWNPSNCKCEYKKKATHLLTEECEEIIDNKTVSIRNYNKTVSIKENNSLDSYKPFASSVLFLLLSVIIIGAFVYFYVNSQSKRKLLDYYYKIKITRALASMVYEFFQKKLLVMR